MRHLPAMRAVHPEIQVEIAISNAMANLTRREAEIAIRPTPEPPEILVGRRVADIAHAIYGSQAYLSRHEKDLSAHDWIVLDDALASTVIGRWINENLRAPPVSCRVDALPALRDAALAGLGLALLPCYLGDPTPGLRRWRRRRWRSLDRRSGCSPMTISDAPPASARPSTSWRRRSPRNVRCSTENEPSPRRRARGAYCDGSMQLEFGNPKQLRRLHPAEKASPSARRRSGPHIRTSEAPITMARKRPGRITKSSTRAAMSSTWGVRMKTPKGLLAPHPLAISRLRQMAPRSPRHSSSRTVRRRRCAEFQTLPKWYGRLRIVARDDGESTYAVGGHLFSSLQDNLPALYGDAQSASGS